VLADLGVGKYPSIVYLGRLVAGKGVEALLDTFEEARARVPQAQLIIVGDGPLGPALRRDIVTRQGIVMTGAIYDERRIACLMTVCRFVLIPGYAGLSVNHAFAYGRPFVTFASAEHKPEIGYLVPGENGFILAPSESAINGALMARLLTDDEWWGKMSAAAHRTAERLPMSTMVANVARAIHPAAAPV
jgi:glycosyltransferase involved in cell wall biosynthesis